MESQLTNRRDPVLTRDDARDSERLYAAVEFHLKNFPDCQRPATLHDDRHARRPVKIPDNRGRFHNYSNQPGL